PPSPGRANWWSERGLSRRRPTPARPLRSAPEHYLPPLRGVEPGTTAHGVDGLETAGADEPGAWIGRHALARPLLDGRVEGFVQRLLCEFEAAEQTDERGEDAARFSSVDRVDHASASAPGPAGSRSPRRAPAGTSRRPRRPRPCPWPR